VVKNERKDDAMKTMTASMKQITEGQINKSVADYRAMLEKHAPQFGSEAVQIVLGQSDFAKEQLEVFCRRVEMVSNMIEVEKSKKRNEYLKLISKGKKIIIGATDGSGTIAKAKKVFSGWIDPDFVKYGTDVKGQPTEKTPVKVFEMKRDATFTQIFGDFGENLNRLCLSQDQIIRFVEEHAKWLCEDGCTFFLLKTGDEYFVASVGWRGGGLGVDARRLSCGGVWGAESGHRVVVPQL
jgi:hypothetical protein